MNNNYIKDIIDLFTHNTYSAKTERQVQQWLADDEFSDLKTEELRRVWKEAAANSTSKELEKSLKTMQLRTGVYKKSTPVIPLFVWKAAVVALLLVSSIFAYWIVKSNEVPADLLQCYIPVAEMRELDLPDGTHVVLNSKSTLLYPDEFKGETRSVYLIGEAYFKVAPNKECPFIVKANDFQITALGTEFNVNAYPESESLQATLIEGSVKVEFDNLTSNLILKPSEQLVYYPKTKKAQVLTSEVADVTAWKDGDLLFKDMHLDEIFINLERKYPYTFIYVPSSMRENTYSFRFNNGASLKEIMEIIRQVEGSLRYEIKDNKCYVINKMKINQ